MSWCHFISAWRTSLIISYKINLWGTHFHNVCLSRKVFIFFHFWNIFVYRILSSFIDIQLMYKELYIFKVYNCTNHYHSQGNKYIYYLSKLGKLFFISEFWMSSTVFNLPLFLIWNRLQKYWCFPTCDKTFFSWCNQYFQLWLGVIFAFILFGVYWASWVCRLRFCIKFGKFFF